MNALQKLQLRHGSGEGRALYELIMERRFGLSRTDILLGKDTTLSADEQAELQIIVDRVAKGEPVQYVLGIEKFCGREFLVRPGVLIPRPETQQLVRLVSQNVPIGSTVLDIGTGSGCIAITQLGADVEFVKGDILQCSMFNVQWNAIVSNPPYICESEAAVMDANVLDHEPHLALFVPDDDPLLFYRVIADYGQEHLVDEGQIFFEVNRSYAEQVAELLQQKGYKEVQVVKDEYENNRFVWAKKIPD